MTQNEDEGLVTKGAMKNAIRKLHTSAHYVGYVDELLVAIDKLPGVSIKSPEEIEQLIEYLEGEAENLKKAGVAVAMLSYWAVADLIRLIAGQKPTRNFWDEEQIFGKPSGKVGG